MKNNMAEKIFIQMQLIIKGKKAAASEVVLQSLSTAVGNLHHESDAVGIFVPL
jgi:hypothetical protein